MDTIADTLSLMNLLAFERFPECARRTGLHLVTLPEVIGEIEGCTGGEVVQAVQEVLRTSLVDGLVRTADVCRENHPELYCRLFPSISDSSARRVLLAHERNGRFMTDQAKVLTVVAGALPNQAVVTSVDIVKQWFEEEAVAPEERTAIVQRAMTFFLPVGGHPLRRWWLGHL